MSLHTNASTTGGPHEDLLVFESKSRVLGWILLFGLCALGFWIISLLPAHPARPGGAAAADVTAGLFVVLAISLIPTLLTSKPKLVVSHSGIYLRSRQFGSGIVAWQDIRSLVVYRILGATFFAIEVTSTAVIGARQNPLQRVVYVLSGWPLMGPTRLSMTASMLKIPIDELLQQIRERYHRELVHHHIQILEPSPK